MLLYGGVSGEHEVSQLSAASILKALDKKKYEIIPVAIDKKGNWLVHSLESLLQKKGHAAALPIQTEDAQAVQLSTELFQNIDVVFPALHGPPYEDGCLQGLFEIFNVAYVGPTVMGSSIAMDKSMTKQLVETKGHMVVPYQTLYSFMSHSEQSQRLKACVDAFSWPLFIKPACQGSSVGTSKVSDWDALNLAVKTAFRYDTKVLVEAYIEAQEIEVAVLGELGKAQASVAGEIAVFDKDSFYTYEAKYLDETQVELKVPADISALELKQIQKSAVEIFNLLNIQGMARVDYLLEKTSRKIYFNELNTLPGFTKISMYPKLWQASGKSYPALLDELIELAIQRAHEKNVLVRDCQ